MTNNTGEFTEFLNRTGEVCDEVGDLLDNRFGDADPRCLALALMQVVGLIISDFPDHQRTWMVEFVCSQMRLLVDKLSTVE